MALSAVVADVEHITSAAATPLLVEQRPPDHRIDGSNDRVTPG
ncbi:hypothetical protein [Saccharothrix coeruleofusca]|nr:hypothetical protein [Saccharothrix coeruleofusca]MBP2337498.1 hypothetical protein [Saccharothrix coeruleofusca]